MQTMLAVGLKRTTVEAIAIRAGVSHMSIYRRWPTKNDVLLSVMTREVEQLFTGIDADIASVHDLAERAVRGFSSLYWFLETHPLVGGAIRADPQTMLPLVTTSVGPAISRAADHITQSIRRGAALTGVTVTNPDAIGEVVARLTHSLLLSPTATTPVHTRAKITAYARRYVAPLIRMEPHARQTAIDDHERRRP